jgi:sugar phosphate isomerase/epimerase
MKEYQFKAGVSLSLGELPDEDENLQALISSRMDYVEIGYRSYCDDPAWTRSVREKLNASPIKINSVHAPFSSEVDISRLDDGGQEYAIEQIGKAIKMAERLGADIVVVHGSAEPIGEDERAKRLDKSRSGLEILSQHVQLFGVRLALEVLPRTCLGNTVDELLMLLADVPQKHTGACLDANHLADPGQLPDAVRQLGERIITLHVSDYDGIDERHWMPFRGIVDWGAFANALRDIEYHGAFVYETRPEEGDTLEEKLEIIHSNFQRILTLKGAEG